RIVASPEVRNAIGRVGPAEVCVEDLRRLIQIASLVIPQIARTCPHVTDLCHPVFRELMLDAYVPFQNARNYSFRSRGLDRAADVGGAAWRQSAWKPAGDKLRGSGNRRGIEVRGIKSELRRVETEVIKYIRFRGVEHPERAPNHRI